ncbi:AT-rich interactive domain-containing protein 5B [Aplochiton taeniatus]
MEPDSLMWAGSPCGLHGPYVFYKALRFNLEGKARIMCVGDFFLVRCAPEEPLCIAELQLLWEETTSKQLLSSSKLYFLPEDTPQGRTVNHGEDEVLTVSEKVIVRLANLVQWTVWDSEAWSRGLKAVPLKPIREPRGLGMNVRKEPLLLHRSREAALNFRDILKEKAELGVEWVQAGVLVLSYPQYCRYRSVVARLKHRPQPLLHDQVVLALGGIATVTDHTRVLYCRDTFQHPTLLSNRSVCDEFAPNLKGRPRKKKLSVSQRRDSQGQQGHQVTATTAISTEGKETGTSILTEGKANAKEEEEEEGRDEEQDFLVALYQYMKKRKTPIDRIPYLGFKQINLWTMFQSAQELGGYEKITARRQWKHVYDQLGGNPGSTSAATCTRRHYERLILPYERFSKGEEDKPLPRVKPRKSEAGEEEKEEEEMRRRKSGCALGHERIPQSPSETPYLPAPPITDDNDVFPLVTPVVQSHAHPAVDLWQRATAEGKDQCPGGLVLATFKQRSLQGPTAPHPPSELADLPRREGTFLGFTPLLHPPTSSPVPLSPLAKKKLLSHINRTGLANHYPFSSSFGPPPPPITSRLTNGMAEDPARQPIVGGAVAGEGVAQRPSVIQHAQSLKTRSAEERREGGQKERDETAAVGRGEERTSLRPPYSSLPHADAPSRLLPDSCSSSPNLCSLYRHTATRLERGPVADHFTQGRAPNLGQEQRHIQGQSLELQGRGAANLPRDEKEEEEEEEERAPQKKVCTFTPMCSSSSSSSSCSSLSTTSQLQHAHTHISPFSEEYRLRRGAGGGAGSFSLHPNSTSRFLGLFPDSLPSSTQDVVHPHRHPLPQSYPPTHHNNHHHLHYLKNQSADLLPPLVPPFTIHSFMMQRQLLAQAAAIPAHLYGRPMAAGYGDIMHKGLYHMSALNPPPAFSPAQVSSGQPSSKLS